MRVKLVPSASNVSLATSHSCAANVVVPLPAPRLNGWRSSKADLPGIVVKTGIAVSSANARKSSVASADSTPAPAQIIGFFAAIKAFAASTMAAASGTCRVRVGARYV